MKPYEALPSEVEYNDKVYELDLSFGVFFAVADILKDERFSDAQRVRLALDMFIGPEAPLDPDLLRAVYGYRRPSPSGWSGRW